jgi:LPXTG-motif cell wall-anchored protein
MAMDPMDREPNVINRETNVYDNTGRGSNTLAYVIGGLVIALGLLAFLFYDGGSNEPSTTGSTATQTQTAPSTGSTGSGAAGGSTTAPATPASPASPAAPASPQQ